MTPQIKAIEQKLKSGKIKNPYPAKKKVAKLKKAAAWFYYLAR